MDYFSKDGDSIERGGKVAADIFCVLLLVTLLGACLGILHR